MLKIIGWILIAVGLLVWVGEVATWNFSGEAREEMVLYDRLAPGASNTIVVDEDDLPLRFDLDLNGWRQTVGTKQVEVTLMLADEDAVIATKRGTETIRKQNDAAGMKEPPADLPRRAGMRFNREDTSIFWPDAPVGRWNVTAQIPETEKYVPDRVIATIRNGSRDLNWYLLIGSFLVIGLGIVAASIGQKLKD